jgi:hypothetical protein
MSATFDQSVLSLESNKNLSCEAYGCNKAATTQITVNVGVLGDVDLNLCKNCVPKFNDSVVTKKGLQNRSLPMEGKKDVFNKYRVSTA